MTAQRLDGWIVLDCDAPDHAPVHIAVGTGDPRPAYRDTIDGRRVAKVRPPADAPARVVVRLIVGGIDVATTKA